MICIQPLVSFADHRIAMIHRQVFYTITAPGCAGKHHLLVQGIELFAKGNTQFRAKTFELLEVLGVLSWSLDLGFDTCKEEEE